MSTEEPSDILRETSPVTALKPALSALTSAPLLVGVAAVVVGVGGGFDYLVASQSPIGAILLIGIGEAVVVPLVWILFYAVFQQRDSQEPNGLQSTLKRLTSRYPAYLGGHVLSRVLFWGVALTVLLGTLPVGLFVAGYTSDAAVQSVLDGVDFGSVFYVSLSLAVLISSVVAYLIQFYEMEALFNDAGPVEAVTNSLSLVRRNHRPVVGYSLIRGLLPVASVGGAGAASGLVDQLTAGVSYSLAGWAIILFAVVVLVGLTAVVGAYQYTFYTELKSRDE